MKHLVIDLGIFFDKFPVVREFIKYSYMPTLAPAEDILITIRSRYERAVIRIEGSDEFFETLRSFVAEAKALRRIEEDNEEY